MCYKLEDIIKLEEEGSISLGELGRLVAKKRVARSYDFTENTDGVIRARHSLRHIVFEPSKKLKEYMSRSPSMV